MGFLIPTYQFESDTGCHFKVERNDFFQRNFLEKTLVFESEYAIMNGVKGRKP